MTEMMAGGKMDQFHKEVTAERAVGGRGTEALLTWLCVQVKEAACGKKSKMKEELLILKRRKKTPLTGRKCRNLEEVWGWVGGTRQHAQV